MRIGRLALIRILILLSSLLALACSSTTKRLSELSPQGRQYRGPRLDGPLEIEIRVFPRVMLRPQEGRVTIYIHGSEALLPKCSGYKIQYERAGSSERLSCELPPRILSLPYFWREYGAHRITFLLFDLEKTTIAAIGYTDLEIGVSGE